MTVTIDKDGLVKFKGADGEWKDFGHWDGFNFKPIVEEPPPILMKFAEVFVDGAGVVDALLPDVEIRGKSMGAPTHVSLLGQMFKIHAISAMEYVSTLDLPSLKLWAEMGGLPMPMEKSIPHLRLDITGEDAIRFRQSVELHQAVELQKTKVVAWYESGLLGATATIGPRTNQGRALSLMDKIPALKERVKCPCTCPISEGRYKVEDCIMHLNDCHHPNSPSSLDGWEPWSRERIADWVDSLPFDFTVQPAPTRGSREEFDALSEYMKVDSPSAAMVNAMNQALPAFGEATAAMLTKIQETVDEALIQKMVDQMKVPISFIVNKEEDK